MSFLSSGIEVKFKNMQYPVIIAATNVPELKKIEYTDTAIRFGASVTLTVLDETLKEAVKHHEGNKISVHERSPF